MANSVTDLAESVVLFRTGAVIDIGATAIRMAIAQIGADGTVQPLERLTQAVNLGEDTFTNGSIGKGTIEDCVRVLRSYQEKLAEYGIDDSRDLRVVATTAVREAANRLAFVDRIYSATGILVDPLDEAEVSRITYLSVLPLLDAEPALSDAQALIVEVGGGSTEVLIVRRKDVQYSHTYRIGSIRLREMLEEYQAPRGKVRDIMENQIRRAIDPLRFQLGADVPVEMVALGGDVRFAASQLARDWSTDQLAEIAVADLDGFTNEVLKESVDALVSRHKLTYPDAETLGPALLANVVLARTLNLKRVLISNANLRDGLLNEFAVADVWTEEFREQIVRSAMVLCRKYQVDEGHAAHVAELSLDLFDHLFDDHKLDTRFRTLLHVAALLHETGGYIATTGHHKHSMYLIRNAELFGLSKSDQLMVALIARYHRRAAPKPQHEGYSTLNRDDRIAVGKLSAILRIADALDRSHSERIKIEACRRDGDRLIVSVSGADDLSLEQLALKQKGSLFEDTFGLKVLLRKA